MFAVLLKTFLLKEYVFLCRLLISLLFSHLYPFSIHSFIKNFFFYYIVTKFFTLNLYVHILIFTTIALHNHILIMSTSI